MRKPKATASRMPDAATPVSASEARTLFAPLADAPSLLVAVSGGPDSLALLWLLHRWRKATRRGPALMAATVDHGLRPEARREARAVAAFAKSIGVAHRILNWRGDKPAAGLQEAARNARYALLAAAAARAKATHVLTAHTLDDQAETVMIRMARGSGVTGLAAMRAAGPFPLAGRADLTLVRPLLTVPKARLEATLQAAGIEPARDPSNADPRFTRVRWRALMPQMAAEGLTPATLGLLAQRARRAEAALDAMVEHAATALWPMPWPDSGPVTWPGDQFAFLPDEIGLRLLGQAVARIGDEGPVELAKLEALYAAVRSGPGAKTVRRTLAGAMVTRSRDALSIVRAPRRRSAALKRPQPRA